MLIKTLILMVSLLFFNQPLEAKEEKMKLTSPAFANKAMIPKKYTCQGEDINPLLEIEGIPQETVSLVLINDDPDAPGGTWDHWIVINIAPTQTIAENSVPVMNDNYNTRVTTIRIPEKE